ncbi:MAG: hypothetical protein AAFO04_13625 [Cyanobacteria bacterium J06592_8]
MNKVLALRLRSGLTLVTLTALSISLFPSIPANAQSAPSGAANDIVCRFRYRDTDDTWRTTNVSGTTRSDAKKTRTQVINGLEIQAESTGTELEVVYLGCRDPWGHN